MLDEGKYRYGRARTARPSRPRYQTPRTAEGIGPDRFFEIFQTQEPKVSCLRANHAPDQIVGGFRKDDPSRLAMFLQSGRDVDSIAVNVVWGRHHVANVYGDPQSNRP